MWVFNILLLLFYAACSPAYQEFVDGGATWYVWIPFGGSTEPIGLPPEFIAPPRSCPIEEE